jgi:Fe-S cluster assembly protein SufD
MNRRNGKIELTAPGANGESYNLFLTSNNEHSDINTEFVHAAADTTSNQIAKGILAGESKGIFTGKIHILKHAQRVASGQLNKNLLLSRKAQVHSMPQLEIFADDVKCSHGSTTGQLSDEELFYFQARGIPANKAKTLLAFGFALEIVKKITQEETRKRIESIVLNLLHRKFQIGVQV